MGLTSDQVKKRLTELISTGEDVCNFRRARYESLPGTYITDEADKSEATRWRTSTLHTLKTVFGEESVHYRASLSSGTANVSDVQRLLGLLRAANDDVDAGFVDNLQARLAADVMDDVLEYAKELCDANHKDPAAVLARVALEDPLKHLARREGIGTQSKAATLNTELNKAGTLTKSEWRQNQAWLDIGNAAAHGESDEYDNAQVARMIEGIRAFTAKHV